MDVRQPLATDGTFRNDGPHFMRGIVNHWQAFNDWAFGRPVKHEIYRPDVVGLRWPQQGLSVADRHLLAFAPSYLQACLRVNRMSPCRTMMAALSRAALKSKPWASVTMGCWPMPGDGRV